MCDTHGSVSTVVAKTQWTFLFLMWVLNVLFPLLTVVIRIRYQETEVSSSSSSPVGCCPWSHEEDHRPTCSPETLPKAQFWFVARIAAPCPGPKYFYLGCTFVLEEVNHIEKQSHYNVGSRTIAGGTGIRVAHCMFRASGAAPDGRRP